jgi:hypothetical protein
MSFTCWGMLVDVSRGSRRLWAAPNGYRSLLWKCLKRIEDLLQYIPLNRKCSNSVGDPPSPRSLAGFQTFSLAQWRWKIHEKNLPANRKKRKTAGLMAGLLHLLYYYYYLLLIFKIYMIYFKKIVIHKRRKQTINEMTFFFNFYFRGNFKLLINKKRPFIQF